MPKTQQEYKRLREERKERDKQEALEKERLEREREREEQRKKKEALQPILAKMREERNVALKELVGKTVKGASYAANLNVWSFVFTDDTYLSIGAAPPHNSCDVELISAYFKR